MSLSIDFAGLPQLPSPTPPPQAFQRFQRITDGEESGFFRLPFEQKHLQNCQQVYQRFGDRVNFLHLGFGGSSLGPEMLVSALGSRRKGRSFTFVSNVDPDTLSEQLAPLKWEETLIYVVSKSGNTPETLALLAAVCGELEKKGTPPERFNEQFVVATEPAGGMLGEWADRHHVTRIPLPPEVGGRYSVLTPVGLLPALFAGLEGEQLLAGAAALAPQLTAPPPDNELVKTAVNLSCLKEQGVTQTVLMPYSEQLKQLSFWFVQLWAESLGKKCDRTGDIVHTGLTPIPARGTTDQHGQMQLFMEGPRDKFILFVEVGSFATDFPLSSQLPLFEGRKLSQLMAVQLVATKKALSHAQRPWLCLTIDSLDEYHLGQLILFLESLTAMTGCLLNIDPFDQPGVEKGKEYARQDWEQT